MLVYIPYTLYAIYNRYASYTLTEKMNVNQPYLKESHIDDTQQHEREHTHFAKITENAKGEPSVTVSIMGDDEYQVHDQLMGLYTMLKKSLLQEETLELTRELVRTLLNSINRCSNLADHKQDLQLFFDSKDLLDTAAKYLAEEEEQSL